MFDEGNFRVNGEIVPDTYQDFPGIANSVIVFPDDDVQPFEVCFMESGEILINQ